MNTTSWEKVNPSPPTFMGEPIPNERLERLREMKANREDEEFAEAERQIQTGGFLTPNAELRGRPLADGPA